MKFYHGTTADAAAKIEANGFETEMVFFCRDYDQADMFGDGTVIEIYVAAEHVRIDFDMPGQAVLTVEEANQYSDQQYSIDEWINFHGAFAAAAEHVSTSQYETEKHALPSS